MQVSQKGLCIEKTPTLTRVSGGRQLEKGKKSVHSVFFSINNAGSSEELMTGQSAESKRLERSALSGTSTPLPPFRGSGNVMGRGSEHPEHHLLHITWSVNSELTVAVVACTHGLHTVKPVNIDGRGLVRPHIYLRSLVS